MVLSLCSVCFSEESVSLGFLFYKFELVSLLCDEKIFDLASVAVLSGLFEDMFDSPVQSLCIDEMAQGS